MSIDAEKSLNKFQKKLMQNLYQSVNTRTFP